MTSAIETKKVIKGGSFILEDHDASDVFTPDDLSDDYAIYRPDPGFTGTDECDIALNDIYGMSDTKHCEIEVNAINHDPVVSDVYAAAEQDGGAVDLQLSRREKRIRTLDRLFVLGISTSTISSKDIYDALLKEASHCHSRLAVFG